MIKIICNEKNYQLAEQTTLAQFFIDNEMSLQTKAVLVNQKFIAHHQYAKRCLTDGDRVTIVAPMQGG